jgi:uncharacterized membrane protein
MAATLSEPDFASGTDPARRPRDPAHDGWPGEFRDGERLARGLGWLSLALGAGALYAPRTIARLAGVREHSALIRAIGVRELASGIGILSERRPSGWVKSRVAGDTMDLTLLGLGLRGDNPHRGRTIGAVAFVAGVMALDMLAGRQLSKGRPRTIAPGVTALKGGRIAFTKAIAVNATPEQCYRLWRDFEKLPRFMKHLEEVRVTDGGRSHWVARGPAGMRVEWDAETTADIPNVQIAWRSLPGATVENEGSVSFEPGPAGRGTLVRANLQYRPPAGTAGSIVARMFGEEPQMQVPEDLRRFKRLVETGEIPTIEGQPHGRRSALGRTFQRMPQP